MGPFTLIVLIMIAILCPANSQYWSDWFKGSFTGTAESTPTLSATDGSHITKVCTKCCSNIDSIEEVGVEFANGESIFSVGGPSTATNWECFQVEENECIVAIQLKQGTLIDDLLLQTSNGRSSPWMANSAAGDYDILGYYAPNECISKLQFAIDEYTVLGRPDDIRGIRAYFITILSYAHQWQSVTDVYLPIASKNHACATDGDSIFIIGGESHEKQLVEYQTSSNTMIDHGLDVLPVGANGIIGQYFTQLHNTIYMISTSGILSYDVSSTGFTTVSTITVDSSVNIGTAACMTSTTNRLFILGGWTTTRVKTVYVLTLSDSTWSSAPSMNSGRVDIACIVVSDYLYAIGDVYTQIERMNINNMIGFDDVGSLTTHVSCPGVVSYNDVIYVIGGFDTYDTGRVPVDKVWVISASDGSVSLLYERLPYPNIAGQGGTIIVNDILYVLGGKSQASTISSIVKYPLIPTVAPTETPTNIPSVTPSKIPTNAPTVASQPPTQASAVPFNIPSLIPTPFTSAPTTVATATLLSRTSIIVNNIIASKSKGRKALEYVVSGASVLLVLACLCGLIVYKRNKGQKNSVMDINKMVEVHTTPHTTAHTTNMKIKEWLTNVVTLPQFYDNFISNGYDTMEFITAINDESELKQIGIVKFGHQKHIMSQIKNLQNPEVPVTLKTPGVEVARTGEASADGDMDVDDIQLEGE